MLYDGNCHCGRFRFTVSLNDDGPSLKKAISICDCPSCKNLGSLWLMAPDDSINVTRREEDLSEFLSPSLHYQVTC